MRIAGCQFFAPQKFMCEFDSILNIKFQFFQTFIFLCHEYCFV